MSSSTRRRQAFGKELLRIRTEAGLSQEQMAARLKRAGYIGREGGMTQTLYSNIERNPTYHNLFPDFFRCVQSATAISDKEVDHLQALYFEQVRGVLRMRQERGQASPAKDS